MLLWCARQIFALLGCERAGVKCYYYGYATKLQEEYAKHGPIVNLDGKA